MKRKKPTTEVVSFFLGAIAKVIKTPISLENEYFYKIYKLLFEDELNEFKKLVSKNPVFNDYYLLKESVISRLSKSIQNQGNFDSNRFDFPSVNSLYESAEHMSYVSYHSFTAALNEVVFEDANSQIELLLNEVSLDINNVIMFSEGEKEARKLLFKDVKPFLCLDLIIRLLLLD